MTDDQIREALRAAKQARKACEAAEAPVRKLQTLAQALIRRGRLISGLPHSDDRLVGQIEILDGPEVLVKARYRKYLGDGDYEDTPYRITFPARWLFLPESHWMAELGAEVDLARAQKAAKASAREAQVRAKAAAAQEVKDRALYVKLHARFGDPAASLSSPSEVPHG